MAQQRKDRIERRQPEWISLQQAALVYGVSVDTLRRFIAAGRLPARRFGSRLIRVRIDEIEGLLRPIPTAESWSHRHTS